MFIINFIAIIYFLNDIYFFASFFVEFDKWEIIQDVESVFIVLIKILFVSRSINQRHFDKSQRHLLTRNCF
jgi:hypothetical protein